MNKKINLEKKEKNKQKKEKEKDENLVFFSGPARTLTPGSQEFESIFTFVIFLLVTMPGNGSAPQGYICVGRESICHKMRQIGAPEHLGSYLARRSLYIGLVRTLPCGKSIVSAGPFWFCPPVFSSSFPFSPGFYFFYLFYFFHFLFFLNLF